MIENNDNDNSLYTKWEASKAQEMMGMMFMAAGWFLFIFSSFQYEKKWWFLILLSTRVLAFLSALLFSLSILYRVKKVNIDDTKLYLGFLLMQALHGLLEGPHSFDFYSYVGIHFIIVALSIKCTFKHFTKTILPISLLGFVLPLFFKDAIHLKSIGQFVDHNSLPVAGFIIGNIIAWINGERFEIKEEMINLQSQIAHDLRSPLAALDMAVNYNIKNPELSKMAIARIHGIANQLLTNKISAKKNSFNEQEKFEVLPIINECIAEKELEFLHFRPTVMMAIQNETSLKDLIYLQGNRDDFRRVISNLLNNAIEANLTNHDYIVIKIKLQIIKAKELQITIHDSGPGIDESTIQNIKKNNFKYSTKIKGQGLGLYYAHRTAITFHGRLEFQNGYPIMALPIYKKISQEKMAVLIDDDKMIHLLWAHSAKKENIVLHCYTKYEDFKREQQKFNKSTPIFIDSHLKEDDRPGEILAQEIFNNGFHNINLCTGFDNENFKKKPPMPWINSIIGKSPVWF